MHLKVPSVYKPKTYSFEGDNCEILDDPCQNVNCKHNGKCKSWGAYWNCTCVDNYNGKYCEKSPSQCDDDSNYCNHGKCVYDNNGFDYCNCDAGYIGLRCESETTDNFNLRFTGISTPINNRQQINAQINNYRFVNELTLCAWVKYEMNTKISPFVILSYLASADNWLPIFWVSNSGIATSGNLIINHDLNNDQWYHVSYSFSTVSQFLGCHYLQLRR